MRKIIKFLSVAILSVIMCLSVVGCQFIDQSYFNPGTSGGGTVSDSVIAAQAVEFATKDEGVQTNLSLPDAVELVERTSVAIEMTSEYGSGRGSGVIVDVKNSGNYVYIVTCHHVISGCGEITVYLPDEECSYENQDYIFKGYIGSSIYVDNAVTLVGGDNVSDIAVIKINLDIAAVSGNKLSMAKVQKAVVPSSDYKVRKGEAIFAIGNPLGDLPGSVADGVVSYLEREVLVSEVGQMNLMQISVTTNPGNSGGGLYNLKGELIGITNAGNTSYDAINFAIPIELENGNGFVSIASQLIATATSTNYGYVSGRWDLGITTRSYSYKNTNYPRIESVRTGSNAEKAGLKVGYMIYSLGWNGQTYTVTPDTLGDYVGLMRTELKVGESFTVFAMQERTSLIGGGLNYYEVNVQIEKADYIFCNTGA